MSTSLPNEADAYFAENPAPPSLPAAKKHLDEFISTHVAQNRRVVLITSGGTTVPLERNTVRFLDNFSAGTRGACSAEYFLKAGYAVVFVHRQWSLLPFARHYTHSRNFFLGHMSETADGGIEIEDDYAKTLLPILRAYKKTQKEGTLLMIPFTTVSEYLHLLREAAMSMRPVGANGVFYLAAAVSDFFVPSSEMSEHKIQSGDVDSMATPVTGAAPSGKTLNLHLSPTPKFLHHLISTWAPTPALVVSFKLETDPAILLAKAKQALRRYGHRLVIGNLLKTRSWEVVFVENGQSGKEGEERWKEDWIRLEGGEKGKGEIEALIIPEVVRRHEGMMKEVAGPNGNGVHDD
ncbi:Phosphopantothenate--cysteine ligase cab2 [Saitoella coloradoensis]